MNKTIITLITIIVIISAIITGILIYKPKENKQEETNIKEIAQEEILDECTDEYEQEQKQATATNSGEEKISPNASITLKTYYQQCGHTSSEYKTVPEELVNKTRNELEELYTGWDVQKFTDTDIVLEKEEVGSCGEHYIVRDKEGKVVIYEIQDDESEKEYEETDIYTEYLTETDKNNIQKGIYVNGKQNLNQLIEDFE